MSNWATKWWKSDKQKDKKTSASSYWYDDYSSDFDYNSFYKGWDGVDETKVKSIQRTQDLYKLNSTRRAISNFVNIVTGKNIPVTYATRSMSYTDGEQVVLSADINDHFDVGVGLALHEGSHIVLSDFDILKNIKDVQQLDSELNSVKPEPTPAERDSRIATFMGNSKFNGDHIGLISRIFMSNGLAGLRKVDQTLITLIQNLTNWIEDRRIDSFIYRSAPGYRQYYLTMYDYYFNSKDVTKGLESDEYRTEDIESYMFRIINLTNEKTDLNALKELRRIYGMIDLKNIGRLKTTADCMNLAIDITEVILDRLGKDADLGQKGKGQGDGEESGDGDINITDVEFDDQPGQSGGGGVGTDISGDVKAKVSPSDGTGDSPDMTGKNVTLSKTALEKLQKAFEKQKKFLQNQIKRKNLSKDEQKSLENIEQSGADLVSVGGDVKQHHYYGIGSAVKGKGVDCVVVKRLTQAVIDSDEFPFRVRVGQFEKEVSEGIKFGTILGNKLQVRSESRDTVFNRLNKGKIDQRLISGLGYGSESVFYTKEVDQYKKANLHISIDYSGSMEGSRIRKAITTVTAIAKAATMARNINLQVSIRSTTSGNHKSIPYIAMMYDSRKDSFSHFTKMITQIGCGNTTPEGLCFEAIQKHLIPSSKDTDSFFLNFSDGEPGYQATGFNYTGEEAAEHTNRQVKRMKENGINILSYFINEGAVNEYSRSWTIFRQCYGNESKWIDTKNMVAVAKTMNEMFLKKSGRE